MVLNCAELESDFFWKWFSRPRQTDGSTVEDYYALFCQWKVEMISLSFPAKEEDYIDGFMGNLNWEIQFRLSGNASSMSRLIDVYYAAKFEESMMIIEENLKQIKANKVFDKMSHPEIEENDQLHGAEDVGDGHSDEILDHIEEVSGNDVSPFANVSIADESVVDYEVNSHTGTPFIRFPSLVFTGLKSFPKELNSIPTNERDDLYSLKADIQHMNMNKEDELKLAKFLVFKDAYQVFDKMPQLTFVWPFKEIFGAESYVHLVDCVPKVFDPGDGIVSVVPVGWRFNEMKSFGPKARKDVPRNYNLDDRFGLNMILTFIFDPGGSFWFSVGCDSINSNGGKQGKRVSVVGSGEVFHHLCDILVPTAAFEYMSGAGDLSSQHGSVIVLLRAKVVGGSRCKTVRYQFVEESKVSDPYLQVKGEEITMSKCRSFIDDPSGNTSSKSRKEAVSDQQKCEFWLNELAEITIDTARHTVPLLISKRNDDSFLNITGNQMYDGVEQSFLVWIKSTKTYYPKLDAIRGHFSDKHNNVTQVLVFDPGICATGKFEQKLNSRLLQYSGYYMDSYHFEPNRDKRHFDSWDWVNGTMVFSTCNAAIGNGDFLGRNHSKHLRIGFPIVATAQEDILTKNLSINTLVYLKLLVGWNRWIYRLKFCSVVLPWLAGNTLKRKVLNFLWNGLATGLESVSIYSTWICLLYPLCVVLVWDPGPCALFAYILEDKDVVERVGKDIILMDATLVIRRYDHELQMRCLDMMDIVSCCYPQESVVTDANCKHVMLQVEQFVQGLDIFVQDRDMGLIYNLQRASTLLHTLTFSCKLERSAFIIHRGVGMIDHSFIIVVENFVWDPGLILAYFRFSTLRTRWLLRGRICHDMTFYYNFYMYFRIMYLAGYDVT